MPATVNQQMALASDPAFLSRLRYLLVQVAQQIIDEDPGTPSHTIRKTYAQGVLANSQGATAAVVVLVVGSTNLVSANTTYDFTQLAVVTDATDAAIKSQLATLWNDLAGV